ncbi:MAG: 4Fe-4S dicluster domain-containing protein [Nitrososphaeria archaeon]|nr:4Fe-4S dicluster domain-containing protein [Nitrososphaeria archaeon]NIN53699.1 4Fe-4S dicluster domain-containing protein [Nitrososphaeria archaeon]NIQ34244.1 4Fe-4S dicluster domain-containing protein [Nitrososphaeria archaeon]
MAREYERTGFLTMEDLKEEMPPVEALRKKQVAMIECLQEIPCDSCIQACPFNAILKETIITPPKVDFDKCTGCTLCARICPGLAVFILHVTDDGKGRVILPYEFLPLPLVGETVQALDREGMPVGEARVIRVLPPEKNEKTALITLELAEDLVMRVRSFRVSRR